jgi:pimeloyl-ACP methyl ester carboxylesterase
MSATSSPSVPIVLRGMGSFHVGGRVVEIGGKPPRTVTFSKGSPPAEVDPNGLYQVEQMYVQYFLPQQRRGKFPLLLWHGGGLSGVTYETTPDGREGWLNMFVRFGWDVYNCDAVERGRSGFASRDVWPSDPLHLPKADPFTRFRMGSSWSAEEFVAHPGQQFPVEAYDNFMRQMAPRWLDTADATMAAYAALIERIGPCVIVVHSQGGGFGFRIAEYYPDKVKALVAVEPAVVGDAAKASALDTVPVLVLYGDYIAETPRWAAMRKAGRDYAQIARAAGARIDEIDLPDVGIRGNSHMLMMDRNNDDIAALIQAWLARKGLVD